MCVLLIIVATLFSVLIMAVITVAPAALSPFSWVPAAKEAGALLGTLLTAQAAIAALTLAVTLFMMQGARRDVDDRMYREYVRRSLVWPIFLGSLIAVGLTGAVFLILSFIGADEELSEVVPGLRNLILLAALAFLANLVLPVFLFKSAIRLSHPRSWRTILRNVNERDVREAVRAFIAKLQRVAADRDSNSLDFRSLQPDQREGSAGEVIQSLLDDARKALYEQRHREFKASLYSIGDLVRYAMGELEGVGYSWGDPGSRPEWPPLRELGVTIDSFREEVIRRGDREQVNDLLSFDSSNVVIGMRRSCGELFTVGLTGYRRNFQIAYSANESETLARLRTWLWELPSTTLTVPPSKAFPYIREMVSQQERILDDAMQVGSWTDFEQLHRNFEAFLSDIPKYWRLLRPEPGSEELYKRLEQHYRIALMGLGGRALLLAEYGRLTEPNQYLSIVREKYPRVEILAEDFAQAVGIESNLVDTAWSEWEWRDAAPLETIVVMPERYPLTWFALRLLELTTEDLSALDLRGNAQKALDWFNANSSRLEPYVPEIPAPTFDERCEFVAQALVRGVRLDVVAEDSEIIRYNLSTERVAALESDVYEACFGPNSIERQFERAGAILDLPSNIQGGPEPYGFYQFEYKGFLADLPENARTYYERLVGTEWGRSLANDLIERFCEALDEAPETTASLSNPEEFLEAIDQAIQDLNPTDELAIILSGDWWGLVSELQANNSEGYEPGWQIEETDRVGDMGRYRGLPIFQGPIGDERCVYVVEPRAWGRLLRADIEGDYRLLVKVSPITLERAQELLSLNEMYFADEPGEDSKIRKLQTRVELSILQRREFRIYDASRARRIISNR